MKILIVEDDDLLAAAISTVLREQHYSVDLANDGQEALALLEVLPYELLVLDLMLPKLDGVTLCQQLRSRGYQLPILLLTARNTTTDKIIGLNAGADDYLVKPFEWQELLARIRALIRRSSSPLQVSLEWGDLRLEPNSCEVVYGKNPLALTPTEYRLLELFLRHPQRVFSCGSLLDYLWCLKEPPNESTIRSHIKGLRRKLSAGGVPADLIETVYGLGYRLKPHQDTKDRLLLEQNQKQLTLSALAQSWERLKPDVLNRVALLEQAAVSILHTGRCGNELRQQAIIEAHKLAGLLGTVGLAKGSELSTEIEDLLQINATLSATQARIWELVEALRQVLKQPLVDQTAQNNKLPRLLIVDDDLELTELLKHEAISWGIQADVAVSPSVARTKILHELPDLVLLDLCFPADPEDGLKLLAELTSLAVPIPVVVFSVRGAFTEQLKVARLKAHAFLQKSTELKQVIAAVNRFLQQVRVSNRVLIVDDDPQIIVMLRTLLEPWGLELTIADASNFWNTLEMVVPNLLVLNVEMPHVDGIKLCRVVRNNPRWDGLAIVAIASDTSPEKLRQILTVGIDDFVAKPVVESELSARIMTQLKRAGI